MRRYVSDFEEEFQAIVGSNIKTYRMAKGIIRKAVAAHLNITNSMLQKYEEGGSKMSVGMLAKLCNFFEVPYDFFFPKKDKKNKDFEEKIYSKLKK